MKLKQGLTEMYRIEPQNLKLASPFGAVPDVTAARRSVRRPPDAQAQLTRAHANRVATLGEVSASIAHEVRQPLAGISLNAETSLRLLTRRNPDVGHAIRAIRQILRDVDRASRITRQIYALARNGEPEVSKLNINDVIKQIVAMIKGDACSRRVTLRLDRGPRLPAVLGDTIQLQQVIMNLAVNAIQAMAPLEVGARNLTIRTRRYSRHLVLVAVQDSGVGVEAEDLDRLFGAFYSTKPNGMGMGLAISRSIIEAHGGRIWAARNAGPGMTFQFTVPIQLEQAARQGKRDEVQLHAPSIP